MIRKLLTAVAMLVALAASLWVWRPGDLQDMLADGPFRDTTGFEPWPLPIAHTDRLFDIGVVDANGDGWLDVFTSNHHFRQVLLLSDGQGGYRDVVDEWKLDQDSHFPLAELAFLAPKPDQPGIYVYWYGTNLIVKAHQLAQIGPWRGSMGIYSGVKITGKEGFDAEAHESREGDVVRTRVDFSPQSDGMLVLTPGSQGLPLDFRFEGVRPEQIFVGLGKVPPKATEFSLSMRDRHGMAWADFNGDGVLDVFINRGALGGALRAFPAQVTAAVRDELLLSEGPGRFVDMAERLGIEKQGCSGRHAMWVDFDGDGLLDLFVNCYDRDAVEGDYPKQLYRQSPPGVLRNVADDVGLALPDQQMSNLLWVDADGDGDTDLVAFQPDRGLFLYRNGPQGFVGELIAARSPAAIEAANAARGSARFYDGKLLIIDLDADGRPDIFMASRQGNVVLRNLGGRFEAIDPAGIGLPPSSMYASWVDIDNDGRSDLFLAPQGIYRQTTPGRFTGTGVLEVHPDRLLAAVANWFDIDNDGAVDLVIALEADPGFDPWWQLADGPTQRSRWSVYALRNRSSDRKHWLQVDLVGDAGNRDGIGALVTARTAGRAEVRGIGWADGSFFSQGHHRAYFGLGDGPGPDELEILWTDGHRQRIGSPGIDRRLVIRRDDAGPATPASSGPPARP
jgi:hypothetical protein